MGGLDWGYLSGVVVDDERGLSFVERVLGLLDFGDRHRFLRTLDVGSRGDAVGRASKFWGGEGVYSDVGGVDGVVGEGVGVPVGKDHWRRWLKALTKKDGWQKLWFEDTKLTIEVIFGFGSFRWVVDN